MQLSGSAAASGKQIGAARGRRGDSSLRWRLGRRFALWANVRSWVGCDARLRRTRAGWLPKIDQVAVRPFGEHSRGAADIARSVEDARRREDARLEAARRDQIRIEHRNPQQREDLEGGEEGRGHQSRNQRRLDERTRPPWLAEGGRRSPCRFRWRTWRLFRRRGRGIACGARGTRGGWSRAVVL